MRCKTKVMMRLTTQSDTCQFLVAIIYHYSNFNYSYDIILTNCEVVMLWNKVVKQVQITRQSNANGAEIPQHGIPSIK